LPHGIDCQPSTVRLRTNGANLLDFPLHDGVLTYRNGAYSRTELFQMMMSKEKGLR